MEDEVRIFGVNARATILSVQMQRGPLMALAVASRFAWEAGQVVAELHGRSRAGAMLQDVTDAVMANMPPRHEPEAEAPPAPPPVAEVASLPPPHGPDWRMIEAICWAIAIPVAMCLGYVIARGFQ